jgi:hypothetical protein
MQTISTKYLPATNFKSARVAAVASGARERVCLSWNTGLSCDENHRAAAKAICEKLEWHGQLQGGHTAQGMVFVFVESRALLSV